MPTISIQQPKLLTLTDRGGKSCYGATQEWYPIRWQKRAGCGPTNCATLMWYLGKTRGDCDSLLPQTEQCEEDFLLLMEQVWHYVTPRFMGINRTSLFCQGALCYARARGVNLRCRALPIPPRGGEKRRKKAEAFLRQAFENDQPVAFLNLSNGKEKNLYSWHWVTLVGMDPGTMMATMYDDCGKKQIDLGLWLQTSQLGGGFVTLEKA